MAKILTPCQQRCEDCGNLAVLNGKWCCKECFNQSVEDIDDCPEGVTLEEVMTIREKTDGIKVVTGASSDKKVDKKPRERKPDVEKEWIISSLFNALSSFECVTDVQISNISKVIEFEIGENHYKLDLIRQRKPKK